MTARLKKTLLVTAGILGVVFGFLTWYRAHYSMVPAHAFEVNSPASEPRVLIATQGSAFKDALVAGVVEHLKERSAYVKVIDLSGLPAVNDKDWSAVVVLHTWQMGKPPGEAKAFIDRARPSGKVVILSTSGAGDFKIEGVDAISAASKMSDVPARVAQITGRVDAILAQATHP
jgi:hypothetical protein